MNSPTADNPSATGAAVPVPPSIPPHKRLGELLIEEELVTENQLEEAQKVQQEKGGFIGQILIQLGFVSQEAVASCLVKQCKIPHLSLMDYDIGNDVLQLVPEEVCQKYQLIPIDKLGRILTVAMVDPLDLEALTEVRQVCPDLRIKPILCNWEHFELVARKVFRKKGEGGSGGATMTAQSLGLGPASAAPKKQVAPPAPEPRPSEEQEFAVQKEEAPAEPVEAASPVRPTEPSSTAPDASMISAEALSSALQENQTQLVDAIHGAMQELGTTLAQQSASTKSTGELGTEGLAVLLQDSLKESLAGVAGELRAAVQSVASAESGAPAAPLLPSTEELAGVIRDSVGGAMQETLATLMVQLRAQHAQDKEHALSTEALGEAIRDSIGGAMQEAMATMLVHMRAMTSKHSDTTDMQDVLAQMQSMMTETLKTSLHASEAAQAAHAEKLSEIAQAALASVEQTSQLVESSVVAQQVQQDLSRGRRTRHASVSPFGLSAGDTTEPMVLEADEQVLSALESEHPLETFTFGTFFPGSANTFTAKLSEAVATAPGGEYNPFFLYGHVGIGKTHLISAIGNKILQDTPQTRVGYVSASHFSRRLAEAIQENAQDAFRENYCHWDVLILDDIQFLGGRVEAQEEFFHIFNVLHHQQRQIIIASDKAPDRLGLLEQRLVSRFSSGIVAELKAPEWETRMKILRSFVEQGDTQVPDEILSLIAMRVTNDIRKMTGSLRKILAFAALVEQEVSCEMADDILNHLGADETV